MNTLFAFINPLMKGGLLFFIYTYSKYIGKQDIAVFFAFLLNAANWVYLITDCGFTSYISTHDKIRFSRPFVVELTCRCIISLFIVFLFFKPLGNVFLISLFVFNFFLINTFRDRFILTLEQKKLFFSETIAYIIVTIAVIIFRDIHHFLTIISLLTIVSLFPISRIIIHHSNIKNHSTNEATDNIIHSFNINNISLSLTRMIGAIVSLGDMAVFKYFDIPSTAVLDYLVMKSCFSGFGIMSLALNNFVITHPGLIKWMQKKSILLCISAGYLGCISYAEFLKEISFFSFRLDAIHGVNFLFSGICMLVYSCILIKAQQMRCNVISIIPALVSNLLGLTIMIIGCYKWGPHAVSFGFLFQSISFLTLLTRTRNEKVSRY